MNVVTLNNRGSVARIASGLGFNCFEFRAQVGERVVDVIHAEDSFATEGGAASHNGIPILFPFPNRIREGKFTWEGRAYELPQEVVPQDSAGNAIHGFCLDRPWRVVAQTEDAVCGAFQLSIDAPDRAALWPSDFLLEVEYRLQAACLRADIRIVNTGTSSLPWGFGTHAYFKVPLGSGSAPDHCLVQAPAGEVWQLVDCLPTGERTAVTHDVDLRDGGRVGAMQLDDVLTGVTLDAGVLETLVMDEKAGLEVRQRCDGIFREVVAFTPPWCEAVCLEPYTCVTDAINLQAQGVDAGLRVLEAGGEVRTWIEIRAGRVLV